MDRIREWSLAIVVVMVYVFLFAPMAIMVFLSFSAEPTAPFGQQLTSQWFENMATEKRYYDAFKNSSVIGLATALLTLLLALPTAFSMVKYRFSKKMALLLLSLTPLVLPNVLIGISILLVYGNLLGVPAGFIRAVVANAVHCFGFVMLVLLLSLIMYDWRFESVARVCGASTWRAFWSVTFKKVWPGILGGFLVAFLFAFNDLEITFYQVGTLRTMPTMAWGMLRHGIKPELYAFSATAMGAILMLVLLLSFLIRLGVIEKAKE